MSISDILDIFAGGGICHLECRTLCSLVCRNSPDRIRRRKSLVVMTLRNGAHCAGGSTLTILPMRDIGSKLLPGRLIVDDRSAINAEFCIGGFGCWH
jgi:hypothetical protein